jgi:hypothetical protein
MYLDHAGRMSMECSAPASAPPASDARWGKCQTEHRHYCHHGRRSGFAPRGAAGRPVCQPPNKCARRREFSPTDGAPNIDRRESPTSRVTTVSPPAQPRRLKFHMALLAGQPSRKSGRANDDDDRPKVPLRRIGRTAGHRRGSTEDRGSPSVEAPSLPWQEPDDSRVHGSVNGS